MSQILEHATQCQNTCKKLAAKLNENSWGQLNSQGFEIASTQLLNELKQLHDHVEKLAEKLSFEHHDGEQPLKNQHHCLQQFMQRLDKNRAFEHNKAASKLAETELLSNKNSHNEQFSALQHQAATLVLDMQRTVDQVLVENHSQQTEQGDKTATRQLLDLLKNRELELHELKKNYAKTRIDALIGKPSEPMIAELEADLEQTNQKIAVHQHRLEESLQHHQQATENMHNSTSRLRTEMDYLQQLVWNHFQKAQEILVQLKKERDAARQLALETERETLGLRTQYTQELLQHHEKISKAKHETKIEFEKRLEKLENELEHKNQTLEHFKALCGQQSGKIQSLEEQNNRFRLLLKTHAKHNKIKAAFQTAQPENSLTD